MEAGPVGEPTARPFIERFFLTLTDRMSRRMHGTTGRNRNDPVGRKGKRVAVEQLITLQELEELLDVTIANYHCTPHDGLNGRTPLEALRQALDHHAVPVRTLPIFLRSRLHQLQSVHLCTVHGSVASGTAPYVSLYGARYSSEVLQRTTRLLRQRIRVYPNPTDMREAWAYLTNGAELGRLSVLDGWRYSRHTLRLRRYILRSAALAASPSPVSKIRFNCSLKSNAVSPKEAARTVQRPCNSHRWLRPSRELRHLLPVRDKQKATATRSISAI